MNQKISTVQATLLVMSTILPTAILTVPSHVVRFSKQDSWISIVLATMFGVAVAALIALICRTNPNPSFLEWLRSRLGRTLSTGIGLLLTYYYFSTGLIILREFINFLSENVLTLTPASVLIIVSVAVAMYGASQGIEVIARINLVVVMAALLFFTVMALLLLKEVHPKLLLPIWDQPWHLIVQGSLIPASWLSEVAIVLLIAPFLTHPQHAGKVGVTGVVLAGAGLGVVVLSAISLFGPHLIQHMAFPTFNMIGIIQLGRFLERVDLLFISIWISMMYVKISIFMFGAFHCFVQTFRVRSEKPFLFALGLTAILSSLFSWAKTPLFNYFNAYALVPLLLTFNVILPFIIWLCLRMTSPGSMKGKS
ncbi:endospore germination permease [Paenibacillus sp. HJGM_3]|uniref:GerAB/ArcD/ProY family transporter n=1 Tax=Paenibacillus sp. HJGM_3 TaxID=3379816 RepID=UPI003859CB67